MRLREYRSRLNSLDLASGPAQRRSSTASRASSSNPERMSRKSIIVLGESGVGKTCFIDMFVFGKHFSQYNPFMNDSWAKWIEVDNQRIILDLMDLSSTTLRSEEETLQRDIFNRMVSRADGVVLLYDVTSRASFERITNEGYLQVLLNREERSKGIPHVTGLQRFGCILVGNKADLAAEKRDVNEEEAEEWAESQGFKCFELNSNEQPAILEAMKTLVRSIAKAERRDSEDAHMEMKRKEAENRPKWQVWNRTKTLTESGVLNR